VQDEEQEHNRGEIFQMLVQDQRLMKGRNCNHQMFKKKNESTLPYHDLLLLGKG
jgi:hypothetical protein